MMNLFNKSTLFLTLSATIIVMAIPGDITDCTIDHGVCVCTGECPTFTSDWSYTTTMDALCIAAENGNATVNVAGLRDGGMNGEVDVDDKEYTAPFAYCPTENSDNKDDGSKNDDGNNGSKHLSKKLGVVLAFGAAVMIWY